MKDKKILLHTTTTEEINFSDLTEREKKIYWKGQQSFDFWRELPFITIGFTIGFVFFMLMDEYLH